MYGFVGEFDPVADFEGVVAADGHAGAEGRARSIVFAAVLVVGP